MVDFSQLIKVGLHFGHQTSRWSPKMAPYIWGHRNGVHLIDVSKIAYNLEKSARFLEEVAARGESILWVGTKKSASKAVSEFAQKMDMPYVEHRWVGGTITNFYQVKKAVTKFLHFEDIVAKAEESQYTKKEISLFQKTGDRLKNIVGGLKTLTLPIGAIVIIDVKKEATAVLEARSAGVPIVGLVDTNSDPIGIDYVIPGNDDSEKGIRFVLDYLSAAVQRGVEKKVIQDSEEAAERVASEAAKRAAKAAVKKTPVAEKETAKKIEAKAVVEEAAEVKPAAKKAKEAAPAVEEAAEKVS
jgi:small subunit ribosomal protein S2